jgi:hypothetical protein
MPGPIDFEHLLFARVIQPERKMLEVFNPGT